MVSRLQSTINLVKNGYTEQVNMALAYDYDNNLMEDNLMEDNLTIKVGNNTAEVESLWTERDGCNPHVMLHVNNRKFEGDIRLTSLPNREIIKVIKYLQKKHEIQ